LDTVDRSPPATAVQLGEVERARPAVADFDAVYAAHFDALTLQMYAYTGDLGQAQDVVQEAFCRAFQRWSKLVGYDDPVAWVRRVAWNLATNRWRQLRRHNAFLLRQREQHVAPPSPNHVALTRALATLPANHRKAVVMHYVADMSIVDIAEQVGVAEGTVKSWLPRPDRHPTTRRASRPAAPGPANRTRQPTSRSARRNWSRPDRRASNSAPSSWRSPTAGRPRWTWPVCTSTSAQASPDRPDRRELQA
jgi:RNA polymerase sigma-70 factor (ECF subfamily)